MSVNLLVFVINELLLVTHDETAELRRSEVNCPWVRVDDRRQSGRVLSHQGHVHFCPVLQ